jgi:hypothetical protein
MKLNELVRSIPTWMSREEREIYDKLTDLRSMSTFDEREQVIIEHLVRKSLVIKVESKGVAYVYPNI